MTQETFKEALTAEEIKEKVHVYHTCEEDYKKCKVCHEKFIPLSLVLKSIEDKKTKAEEELEIKLNGCHECYYIHPICKNEEELMCGDECSKCKKKGICHVCERELEPIQAIIATCDELLTELEKGRE